MCCAKGIADSVKITKSSHFRAMYITGIDEDMPVSIAIHTTI